MQAEVHGKSDGLDFFESEIFEWTQRACSPELLPSPAKTQVLMPISYFIVLLHFASVSFFLTKNTGDAGGRC